MSLQSNKNNVPQKAIWQRYRQLLATTNYIPDPSQRKRAAMREDKCTLKDSCLSDQPRSNKEHWETRVLPIDRLYELVLEECEVGVNGTAFREVVGVVRNALHLHNAQYAALCVLYFSDKQIEMTITKLNGKEAKIRDDITCDPNMIAAAGGTVDVSSDSLFVRWPLFLG